MDLLSLPDEMICSVLKFVNFEAVTQLRKMNVRIDEVAVRNDLHKAKIILLSAEADSLDLTYTTSDIVDNTTNKSKSPIYVESCLCIPGSDIQFMFERQIEKVRGLKVIHIGYCDVDEKWLNLLGRIKNSQRTDICFRHCNFEVSLTDLKRVLGKFGLVEIGVRAENTFLKEVFSSDEVMIQFLPWAGIRFNSTENHLIRSPTLSLTDQTLEAIQTYLPHTFSVGDNFTQFTVPEVIRTMRFAINTIGKSKMYWKLGNVRARTTDEFLRATEELKRIEGVIIESYPENIHAWIADGIYGYHLSIYLP